MSRYVNDVRTNLTPQQAQTAINDYLQAHGFKYVDERGEMAWRKGMGALANPQFIKAEPTADGTVRVEAWTAGVSLLPGVYGGEMDPMSGAFGFGPKLALKPRVLELERLLGARAAQQVSAGADPGWYADPAGRHESRYWDGTRWTTDVADGGQSSRDEGVT